MKVDFYIENSNTIYSHLLEKLIPAKPCRNSDKWVLIRNLPLHPSFKTFEILAHIFSLSIVTLATHN